MSTWELLVRVATNGNVAMLSAALLGYLDPTGKEWLFHLFFWPSAAMAGIAALGLLVKVGGVIPVTLTHRGKSPS